MATKPRYTVLSAMLRLTDITPPAIPAQSAKRGFRKPPDSTHLLFFCLVFEEHRISISQFWQPQYASESLFFMSSWLYVMRCGPNRVIYIHPSATTSHLLAVRVEVERAQPKPQYCQRLPLTQSPLEVRFEAHVSPVDLTLWPNLGGNSNSSESSCAVSSYGYH